MQDAEYFGHKVTWGCIFLVMWFYQPGRATVMRRGRLRLAPFTRQRTDKAQRRRLDPRPSVFTPVASPDITWHR